MDAVLKPLDLPSFETMIRRAQEAMEEARTAEPMELVAVKSPMGGFEMRLQPVGVVRSYGFKK